MTWQFDHARQTWVLVPPARTTITVHPPATTRPLGFVWPEQPEQPPKPKRRKKGDTT